MYLRTFSHGKWAGYSWDSIPTDYLVFVAELNPRPWWVQQYHSELLLYLADRGVVCDPGASLSVQAKRARKAAKKAPVQKAKKGRKERKRRRSTPAQRSLESEIAQLKAENSALREQLAVARGERVASECPF